VFCFGAKFFGFFSFFSSPEKYDLDTYNGFLWKKITRIHHFFNPKKKKKKKWQISTMGFWQVAKI